MWSKNHHIWLDLVQKSINLVYKPIIVTNLVWKPVLKLKMSFHDCPLKGWPSQLWSTIYVSHEDSFGGCRYVTQNFDTKQAGRRIFEISVYRPGKFDAHTMTLRQDGGFSAERKMSQLATPQDLLPQDFLRAARNLLHNAHQSKANAICEPISLVKRDRVCAPGLFFAADGPGFSARPPSPQRPLPKRGSESDPGFYSTANGRKEGQLGSRKRTRHRISC